MRYILIIIASLLALTTLSAQERIKVKSKYFDVVYLKDGSQFRGVILVHQVGELVVLKELGGKELTFTADKIEKIIQEPVTYMAPDTTIYSDPRLPFGDVFQYPTRGFYATFMTGFMYQPRSRTPFGNEGTDVDFSSSISAGWKFNQYIGAGLGVGVSNYFNQNLIPIFAEVRGYLGKRSIAPYYSLAAGYAVPIKSMTNNIYVYPSQNDGGLMLYPAIGLRIGKGRSLNFLIDFGFQYQQMKQTFIYEWDGSSEVYNYQFRRWALRAGMVF